MQKHSFETETETGKNSKHKRNSNKLENESGIDTEMK